MEKTCVWFWSLIFFFDGSRLQTNLVAPTSRKQFHTLQARPWRFDNLEAKKVEENPFISHAGSMGGTVYVCLHLSKKWTKCRCIKTIHYMDPMDMLTWLFVTCWFYVFFGQNKFRTVFPANEAQGKVGGTTIPLNTFNCMSNLNNLEEELDDSEVNISSIFTSPSGNIFHSCSKTLISILTNHSNTYSQNTTNHPGKKNK